MEIKRFYVNNSDIVGEKVTITGDEAMHITSVLRHKVGYKIIVCNNTDHIDYHCTIISIDKYSVCATIDSRVENNCRLSKSIRLVMCLPKGDKADFVLQKAVEIGADEIVFVTSDYVNESKFNLARLVKIARDAAKQCGSSTYPNVVGLISFDEYIVSCKNSDLTILMYEKEHITTLASIEKMLVHMDKINVIIGSEGGFSDREYALAMDSGAVVSVSLGSRIMRCETAAIAALTLVSYSSGAMYGRSEF